MDANSILLEKMDQLGDRYSKAGEFLSSLDIGSKSKSRLDVANFLSVYKHLVELNKMRDIYFELNPDDYEFNRAFNGLDKVLKEFEDRIITSIAGQ